MNTSKKSVFLDLVCGMTVSEFENEPMTLKHHGKIYYFCSETCRHHFEINPEKYLLSYE